MDTWCAHCPNAVPNKSASDFNNNAAARAPGGKRPATPFLPRPPCVARASTLRAIYYLQLTKPHTALSNLVDLLTYRPSFALCTTANLHREHAIREASRESAFCHEVGRGRRRGKETKQDCNVVQLGRSICSPLATFARDCQTLSKVDKEKNVVRIR